MITPVKLIGVIDDMLRYLDVIKYSSVTLSPLIGLIEFYYRFIVYGRFGYFSQIRTMKFKINKIPEKANERISKNRTRDVMLQKKPLQTLSRI